MSFRDQFAQTPPGPKREALVYNAVLNQGAPSKLYPVTVNGPNGVKVTYYVAHDFLNTDGVWLPMTGVTAQKVADNFGMYLATPKMVDQIHGAATTKITPTPLSTSGYGQYSAQQVVNSRISASDAALAFSQRIADQQKQKSNEGIVDGHMKTITQAPSSGHLGLHGMYRSNDTPIQNTGGSTGHGIADHTEYASGVRLIGKYVDITYPDGRKERMTLDQFMKSDLAYLLGGTKNGVARYDLTKDRANLSSIKGKISPADNTPPVDSKQSATPGDSEHDTIPSTQYTPAKPTSGRFQILQRINDYFSDLVKEF